MNMRELLQAIKSLPAYDLVLAASIMKYIKAELANQDMPAEAKTRQLLRALPPTIINLIAACRYLQQNALINDTGILREERHLFARDVSAKIQAIQDLLQGVAVNPQVTAAMQSISEFVRDHDGTVMFRRQQAQRELDNYTSNGMQSVQDQHESTTVRVLQNDDEFAKKIEQMKRRLRKKVKTIVSDYMSEVVEIKEAMFAEKNARDFLKSKVDQLALLSRAYLNDLAETIRDDLISLGHEIPEQAVEDQDGFPSTLAATKHTIVASLPTTTRLAMEKYKAMREIHAELTDNPQRSYADKYINANAKLNRHREVLNKNRDSIFGVIVKIFLTIGTLGILGSTLWTSRGAKVTSEMERKFSERPVMG